MIEHLAINGRFQHMEPGGFRRFAAEVASRLPGEEIVPQAFYGRGLRGNYWERRTLPDLVGQRTLVNLTGSAPFSVDHQVTVVHDILPMLLSDMYPSWYVRSFAARLSRVLDVSARIVTPSHDVRSGLIDRFGLDEDRLSVAWPGLTRPDVAPEEGESRSDELNAVLATHGIRPDQPLIVGVNSSVPRKNGASTLNALEAIKLARPEVAVVAVGFDGPARVFGRNKRPVSTVVPDLGAVPEGLREALWNRSDVVVTLPHGEGFGLIPVEAAAAGATVVSSPMPSLTHLTNGCCVVDDWQAAAEAALELLDGARYDYSHLYDRLTWDRTADRILDSAMRVRNPDAIIDLRDPNPGPQSRPADEASKGTGGANKWQES